MGRTKFVFGASGRAGERVALGGQMDRPTDQRPNGVLPFNASAREGAGKDDVEVTLTHAALMEGKEIRGAVSSFLPSLPLPSVVDRNVAVSLWHSVQRANGTRGSRPR